MTGGSWLQIECHHAPGIRDYMLHSTHPEQAFHSDSTNHSSFAAAHTDLCKPIEHRAVLFGAVFICL